MSYILITLCRNEEKNILNLVQSVLAQTIKPICWVIVDDRSEDTTAAIIKDIEQQNDWIQGLYLTEKDEYMGSHYSRVFNIGLDFILRQCLDKNHHYEYIALVDADNILEKTYFEKLIDEFQKNPKLGIASGISAFIDVDTIIQELEIDNVMDNAFWDIFESKKIKIQDSRDDIPMGSARMWRKKCFEETGGYLFTHSPDSVSNVKAKMKGWETKRISSAKVLERAGFAAQGQWEGHKKRGISDYYIWYPLYLAILRTIKWSVRKPFYLGIAYLYGYLSSHFSRVDRLEDDDVKEYNQKIRLKEIKMHYSIIINKLLGL